MLKIRNMKTIRFIVDGSEGGRARHSVRAVERSGNEINARSLPPKRRARSDAPYLLAVGLVFVLSLVSAPSEPVAPAVATPAIPSNNISLADFGRGDGRTLNTSAFEKAIATLGEKGGGTLTVPSGIWLTGPIKLQSKINLHLERGALIQFSRDYKLFPLAVVNMRGEKEVAVVSPISGENLEDVAITGDGIIDGGGDVWRPVKKEKLLESDWRALVRSGGVLNQQGDIWWPSRQAMEGEKLVESLRKSGSLQPADYEPAHVFLRPRMLRLLSCKRVLLEGVTFQNPPNWTLNPSLCEDVSILHVQVHNSYTAQNSDALDLESCHRAIIRDCIFDAGDDGICIKAGKDAAGRRIGVPTEDVLIEGCTVYHAHGGFVIGSETSGSVRNVRVDNCTFIGTDIGLRFKTTRGRGGVVEKIYVSNVRMEDIPGDAISFNMYYGGKAPLEENGGGSETQIPPVNAGTPQFRDIHIENIVCRGAQRAIALEGLPELPLRDVELKNVSIISQQGVFVTDADGIHFENVRVENKSGARLTQVHVKNSQVSVLE